MGVEGEQRWGWKEDKCRVKGGQRWWWREDKGGGGRRINVG